MRYGILLTTGDPRSAAELAAAAELAGWDGVFTWDGIAIGDQDTFDPWIVMAAMAMRTDRVRLGAIVTPPSRRRPWKLAREAMTLDRLSNGRLVLPVGLGALDDAAFGTVGELTDMRSRAERLDESLAILAGLWTGQPFAFDGRHYRFGPMTFRPPPIQRPRIPIWVVAAWPRPRSMRRALAWDGILLQVHDDDGQNIRPTPEVVAAVAEHGAARRTETAVDGPWEIVIDGTTPADDPARAAAIVAPFAAAGATWWIEADWEQSSVEGLRRRIAAGPPGVTRR